MEWRATELLEAPHGYLLSRFHFQVGEWSPV